MANDAHAPLPPEPDGAQENILERLRLPFSRDFCLGLLAAGLLQFMCMGGMLAGCANGCNERMQLDKRIKELESRCRELEVRNKQVPGQK